MEEAIVVEKYKLAPIMEACKPKIIRQMMLIEGRKLDESKVREVLLDFETMVYPSDVRVIDGLVRVLDEVCRLGVNNKSVSFEMLVKLHKLYETQKAPYAGVIRVSELPASFGEYEIKSIPDVDTVKEQLVLISKMTDKLQSAKQIFLYLMQERPFYSGNTIIAYAAAAMILFQNGLGLLSFSEENDAWRITMLGKHLTSGGDEANEAEGEIEDFIDERLLRAGVVE